MSNEIQKDLMARIEEMHRRQQLLPNNKIPLPNLPEKEKTSADTSTADPTVKIEADKHDFAFVHIANQLHTHPQSKYPMVRFLGNFYNHEAKAAEALSREIAKSSVSNCSIYKVPVGRFTLSCADSKRQCHPHYATNKIGRLLELTKKVRTMRDQDFKTERDKKMKHVETGPAAVTPDGFLDGHDQSSEAKLDRLSKKVAKDYDHMKADLEKNPELMKEIIEKTITEFEKEKERTNPSSSDGAKTDAKSVDVKTPAVDIKTVDIKTSVQTADANAKKGEETPHDYPRAFERRQQNYAVMAILSDYEFFDENDPENKTKNRVAHVDISSIKQKLSDTAPRLVLDNVVEEPGFAMIATFDREDQAREFCDGITKQNSEFENYNLFVVSMYTWIPLHDKHFEMYQDAIPTQYRNKELNSVMIAHRSEQANIAARQAELSARKDQN